MNLHFCTE